LAQRAARDLGIDYVYANELITSKGRITGEFNWPLGNGGEKKVEILKQVCTSMRATPKDAAFIGDGESDIPAMQLCGLPIAFNADSDKVKKAARFVVITKNLKDIIPHLQEKDEF
jgi:phosphoserine phosphatase